MKRMFVPGLALLAASAVVGSVACGGDDDDTAPAATTSAAKTATTAAGGGSEATKLAVTAKDFAFEPAGLEVKAGAKVEITLTNKGAAPHTFTLYLDKEYTSKISGAGTGNVAGGASATFPFSSAGAGTVYYRCDIHPAQMKGEMAVK